MAVLYQLSYVGAEGNRIAAGWRLSGAVGKPDRPILMRRRLPRAGFVPIYSPRRRSVSRCSSSAHGAAPRALLLCQAARKSLSSPRSPARARRSSSPASRAFAGLRTVWISRYASGSSYVGLALASYRHRTVEGDWLNTRG
jgi:hypothetical protein